MPPCTNQPNTPPNTGCCVDPPPPGASAPGDELVLSDGRTVTSRIPQGPKVRAEFRHAIAVARGRAEQYFGLAETLAGAATEIRTSTGRDVDHPLGSHPDDRIRPMIDHDLANLWELSRRLEGDATALLAYAGVFRLKARNLEGDLRRLFEANAFEDTYHAPTTAVPLDVPDSAGPIEPGVRADYRDRADRDGGRPHAV